MFNDNLNVISKTTYVPYIKESLNRSHHIEVTTC